MIMFNAVLAILRLRNVPTSLPECIIYQETGLFIMRVRVLELTRAHYSINSVAAACYKATTEVIVLCLAVKQITRAFRAHRLYRRVLELSSDTNHKCFIVHCLSRNLTVI